MRQHFYHQLRSHPSRAWIERWGGKMGGSINRLMILIINALDDITLFANPGVWKSAIGGRQVLLISFKDSQIVGGARRGLVAPDLARSALLALRLNRVMTHAVARTGVLINNVP